MDRNTVEEKKRPILTLEKLANSINILSDTITSMAEEIETIQARIDIIEREE